MSLDLSLVLSPAQENLFNTKVGVSDSQLSSEEIAAIESLRQSYDEKRRKARRAILLELLGVSNIVAPTPVSEPVGMTAREIAEALGYHKDSVNNWVRNGLLPVPVDGTGTSPYNPARYMVNIEELRAKVEARQEAAKIANAAKIAKKPLELSGPTMTWEDAALVLGISRDTVRLYIKRGLLTGGAGLATVESVNHYKANRLPPGQTKAKIAASAPTPKDEEIESAIEVEPRPAPQLSEAAKHDYHWRNALPVLESAIETADASGEVALEVAYQTTPGNYEQRGSFVVRPFGQLGPGLIAFVRATKESGKWSVTIPLRVESWIKPMAEGLRDYWRDRAKVQDVADYRRSLSSDSPTRSLQA